MSLSQRLTPPATAATLGITLATLRKWIRERRLPFYRVGRLIRFDQSEVERFLSRCRVASRDEDEQSRSGGRGDLGHAAVAGGAPARRNVKGKS